MMQPFLSLAAKTILMVATAGVGLFALSQAASAQSRINANSFPVTTMWLQEPGEIGEIRGLLNNGNAIDAIDVAETFLDKPNLPAEYRYAGLNALCIAHSANGERDLAMTICDKAIALIPNRWQAINSRGTIKFMAGHYAEALEDYRKALTLAPDSEVIRYNITLAEGRVRNS